MRIVLSTNDNIVSDVNHEEKAWKNAVMCADKVMSMQEF